MVLLLFADVVVRVCRWRCKCCCCLVLVAVCCVLLMLHFVDVAISGLLWCAVVWCLYSMSSSVCYLLLVCDGARVCCWCLELFFFWMLSSLLLFVVDAAVVLCVVLCVGGVDCWSWCCCGLLMSLLVFVSGVAFVSVAWCLLLFVVWCRCCCLFLLLIAVCCGLLLLFGA